MEKPGDINTFKCCCFKIKSSTPSTMLAMERKKNIMNSILCLLLIVLIICMLIYFLYVVDKFNAKFDSINKLQTDIRVLEKKHNRLERRLKASLLRRSNIKTNSLQNEIIKTNEVALDKEETGMMATQKASLTESSLGQKLLSRVKRSKRKKKCKNCLPAIQIEGIGGNHQSPNKFDVSGLWSPATWHDRYQPASISYKYSRVGHAGLVNVRKTGLYLLYAQVTLTGSIRRGYHIILKHANGNESPLAACKSQVVFGEISKSDSCCTVKIVTLTRGDGIFVREETENTGANYSKSHSYFGLIRLGSL